MPTSAATAGAPSTLSTPISASTSSAASTPSTAASASSHNEDPAVWQVQFGFWDDCDVVYNAFPPPAKPRIPSLELDSALEWAKRMVPATVEVFLGNPAAIQTLHELERGDLSPLTNFIVSGAECTGKLSFIGLLKRSLLASGFDPPCTFGSVNAKQFSEKDLLLKIEDFVRRIDPHKTKTAFLVVERFEAVTPSAQQHFVLPLLQDANAKGVFCIFHVRPDVSKVAKQITQRSLRVHLHSLKPMHMRTKFLRICTQERIGFTRDGLEDLLARNDFKLLASMDALRLVFQRHYFVSLPNTRKPSVVAEPSAPSLASLSSPSSKRKDAKRTSTSSQQAFVAQSPPPFALSILEMNEPLRRCTKCTLLPPCAHVSMETLFDRLQRVRSLYPRQSDAKDRKDKGTTSVCPSFVVTGVCHNIQALGRCCYAHPLALHTIDTSMVVQRCRVHTLPLPCSHCANVSALHEQLRLAITACLGLETQLRARRKQLSDRELTRVLFVRDRAKNMKWGASKREYDDTLARMDTELASLRSDVDALTTELVVKQATRDQLERDHERGTSYGTLSQARTA